MANLFYGLVEDDLIEATSDFLPLALRRLIQMVGVRAEALVQEAHDKEWLISAARCGFAKALQHEHVLPMRIERRELKEFSQFVR